MTSIRTAGLRARRRPAAAYAVIVVALAVVGVFYAAVAPSSHAQSGADAATIAQGRDLFLQACSSCHGLQAQGSSLAPSLIGVGGAAVDFQVGTGRMPLANRGPQPPAKPVRFNQGEIDAMAAYIESLGGGPEQPSDADLSLEQTELALGGTLFRTNCAQCHNFAGRGGELTYGKYAPSLADTTPRHIYEAMLTGPSNMPVFGDRTITPDQKRDIIRYITHLRAQPNPGGNGLDRIGPVPEGLVAWLVGIGGLVAATVWIGARAK